MKKQRMQNSVSTEYILVQAALWGCAGLVFLILPNANLILPTAGLFSVLLILACCFPEKAQRLADFFFRYRWCLALLVFLACVVLRVHGSSIGVYNEIFPTQITERQTTLFGIPRWIRSDEYGVTTPMYFSQAANDYRFYSRQMSISPTNMVMDYYSPVWDWTVIGKPFNWGYLLFGNEIGLSWYWCGEIILLFMTALEMCLILTCGQRRVSLLGAVLVALSPEIQWWVIPQLPLALFYAMALFCSGYWFASASGAAWKAASSLVLAMMGIGFVLSVLPTVQIPALYLDIALLIACLHRDRERLFFTGKDLLRLIFSITVIVFVLGSFVLKSIDDFPRAFNTVYPGKRISTGGTWRVDALFPDLTTLFLPYRNSMYLNNCEVSCFVQFAPFLMLFSPRIMPYLKEKGDRNLIVGRVLLWATLCEAFFMLAGIPEAFAKASFLSYSNRMDSVYDWTATLFTVWGFSELLCYPDIFTKREKMLYSGLYGVISFAVMDDSTKSYFHSFSDYFGHHVGDLLLLASLLLVVLIILSAQFRQKTVLSTVLILTMIFCGGTVNPVERGIGAVTNHPVSDELFRLAKKEPDAGWLVTDCDSWLSNYVLAHGARVLDATNVYPDYEKWKLLDPEDQYLQEVNRYANESAVLTDEKSSIEVVFLDHLKLHINPESLKSLRIRYLFTPVDHTELLSEYGITCVYLTGQDGYGIWRLDYNF